MTMDLVYRFLLIGLHFAYSFFNFIANIVRGLKIFLSNFVCFRLPAQSRAIDFEQLLSVVKRLQKVPQHFVFLIGENDIFLDDVINVINWCVASGIYYVSVYDHEGSIKKFKDEIQEILDSGSKKNVTVNDTNDVKVDYCVRESLNDLNSPHVTVQENHKTCFVTLLSSHDGRNGIVNTAVDLAYKVSEKQLDVDKFELKDLENKLMNYDSYPYPNLLITCGKICSTIGFLPWHLHLTEILNYDTHRNFTMEKFIGALMQYSNCEQRLGK